MSVNPTVELAMQFGVAVLLQMSYQHVFRWQQRLFSIFRFTTAPPALG